MFIFLKFTLKQKRQNARVEAKVKIVIFASVLGGVLLWPHADCSFAMHDVSL